MRLGSGADTGYSDTYYLWIYFGLGAASIVLQVGLLSCCLRALGQSDPKHLSSFTYVTVAGGQICWKVRLGRLHGASRLPQCGASACGRCS